MADASRGNVSYDFPVAPGSGTEANTNVLKSMCDIIKVNLQEVAAWERVESNPHDHDNGTVQYRTMSSGYESQVDNAKNSIYSNKEMTANDVNTILNLENILMSKIGVNSGLSVNSGSEKLNQMLLIAINHLIGFSNYAITKSWYWGSNNYCKINCQVSCQQACQLACQSCQYDTCHDQNCGGWS